MSDNELPEEERPPERKKRFFFKTFKKKKKIKNTKNDFPEVRSGFWRNLIVNFVLNIATTLLCPVLVGVAVAIWAMVKAWANGGP